MKKHATDQRTTHERAQHAARVRRWQHAQKAAGQCRCGARIELGSAGRCAACLERCRRDQRRRRGTPVSGRAGRKRRGRKIVGDLGARWKAVERVEARPQRERVRTLERREVYQSEWVVMRQAGCVLRFDRATNRYVSTRVYR